MIHCDDFSAQAIYVGADEQLGNELRNTIDAKPGWTFHRVIDVETASAMHAEQPSTATILYVDGDSAYTQALQVLNASDRETRPTLVIYDHLGPDQLLELFKAGAVECLGRPLNLTRLSLVMDMLMVPGKVPTKAEEKAKAEAAKSKVESDQADDWYEKLMAQVNAVANLSTTVLITGETGTGKTRLSRLIHGLSDRKSKPFLALNCGALSESLLDSELFGHSKGAFTGANQDYEGKLAQCKDGTLLLDEIDMLSPAAQVKLLQVVEDRVFQPVGSTEFHPLQARLIVASNRALADQVAAGKFRSDLFYRLNVMSFQLPPLRERRDEITPLVKNFISEFANMHGIEIAELAPQAEASLRSYAWPGNIRELRNVVERAVILSAGKVIEVSHLPTDVADSIAQAKQTVNNANGSSPNHELPSTVVPPKNKLASARMAAERRQLLDALERNDNNRSKTAIDLGISRVALYKRLRKLHIS